MTQTRVAILGFACPAMNRFDDSFRLADHIPRPDGAHRFGRSRRAHIRNQPPSQHGSFRPSAWSRPTRATVGHHAVHSRQVNPRAPCPSAPTGCDTSHDTQGCARSAGPRWTAFIGRPTWACVRVSPRGVPPGHFGGVTIGHAPAPTGTAISLAPTLAQTISCLLSPQVRFSFPLPNGLHHAVSPAAKLIAWPPLPS